ncbi:MAG: hypothetical protein ACR2PT_23035 [Endozoicomonas sp.]
MKKPVRDDDDEELERKRRKIEEKKKKALKVVVPEGGLELKDKVYLQKKLEAIEESFYREDVGEMTRHLRDLNKLGRNVMQHVERRLKQLLSLPPYRSGYVDDKEVQEVNGLLLFKLLREALMNGISMKIVQYISEVATAEDIARFRQALKSRKMQSVRLDSLPEPLRTSEWDIEFVHDDSAISSEAVSAMLEKMEHISILTRENGLVRPQPKEIESWRSQYFRDAERIKVVIHYKELLERKGSASDRPGRRPNIRRSTVIFDSASQREFLSRRNLPSARVTEGLNQVALDIPEFMIPGDEEFAFILNILLNQTISIETSNIVFGGVLNKELIKGLLQEELNSGLVGHAGNVLGNDRRFSSEFVVNLTSSNTLDIEMTDTYRMCYQRSQPGTYSPCNITIRQRYAFEKTEDGWLLVGKSFNYHGRTGSDGASPGDKTVIKMLKARTKDGQETVRAVHFDPLVFDDHLIKVSKYMDVLEHDEDVATKARNMKEALKKIDLAFKMLIDMPAGEKRSTAEARVIALWKLWKEKHPRLIVLLESEFRENPVFNTPDATRAENLTTIYQTHVRTLKSLQELEGKFWELARYIEAHQDGVPPVDSAELMKKLLDYRNAAKASVTVVRDGGRESGSSLQVLAHKLKLTREENRELNRAMNYFSYLQTVIQSNQDLIQNLARGMYAQARKIEGRDSEPVSSFTTGYAAEGPEVERISDTPPSPSRSSFSQGEGTPRKRSATFGGQRQRESSMTTFDGLMQRASSITNLHSIDTEAKGKTKKTKEKKPKKGKKSQTPIKLERSLSGDEAGVESTTNRRSRLINILAKLRSADDQSDSPEVTPDHPRQIRSGSDGLIPHLRVNRPETRPTNDESDSRELTPAHPHQKRPVSDGLILQLHVKRPAPRLISSYSGGRTGDREESSLDFRRKVFSSLPNNSPYSRKTSRSSTYSTPQSQEEDVFTYNDGKASILQESTQQRSSVTDLSPRREGEREQRLRRSHRATYSDRPISMEEELSTRWDEMYDEIAGRSVAEASQPHVDEGAVQAVITDIIQRNLSGSLTPSQILSQAILDLTSQHGDLLNLADDLQVNMDEQEGTSAVVVDDITNMLEIYFNTKGAEGLAKILSDRYGQEFIGTFYGSEED